MLNLALIDKTRTHLEKDGKLSFRVILLIKLLNPAELFKVFFQSWRSAKFLKTLHMKRNIIEENFSCDYRI